MAGAMAETVSYVNRARAFMPVGTVPPFVMRFDAGSVPVGDLVFTDTTGKLSLKDMQDAALFRVRPLFATLPGVSAPPPFGGAPRTIVISADPDRLRAYNMSPDEVVSALTKGNAISPSGNVRFGNTIPMVPVNSVVSDVRGLGDVPIRSDGTRTVFIRDIGKIEDASDIETGYAIVNGHRTVYISVTKRSDASTLSVVNLVKANLPKFQSVLPEGVKVSYEFDQSPYVVRAILGLTEEGALGAVLTGLMVLLFLRDWRSALVVVVNIPLAILAAVMALWATGQTINLMTLGGLALAVGILVDEGTVVIENVHSHIARGDGLRQAAYNGTTETLGPNFLAMLCILAVFISAFFMQGAAHNLFIPMALAVGFAMIASYVLSTTLVPILLIWLLPRGHATEVARTGGFDRFRERYRGIARRAVALRWTIVGAYLLIAAAVIVIVGGDLGREIFPQVDAGQFALRLRGPPGTRIEETEKLANRTLDVIAREVGKENVEITLGFVGVQNAAYPINTIYLWTSGPEEAMLQVQLNRKSGISVAALRERLRKKLPEELPDVRFSFEPNDIVSQVMSFGAPTPIEVAVSGPDFAKSRQFAQQIQEALGEVTPLRDLAFQQELDYPAVKVVIDREVAGMLGVTADQIGRSLTEATSSSRFTVPNFWPDPRSGVGYQVQVQVPTPRMNSLEEVKNIVIGRSHDTQINLRNVADVSNGTVLGEYDRYNMQRMLTLGANIQRRRSRPRGKARLAGDRKSRQPAGRRQRQHARPGGADAGDVRRPPAWAVCRNYRDLPSACGELPILPPVAGDRAHNPGRVGRRHARPMDYPHHAEHPIAHGSNHGDRRCGGERDLARLVCGERSARRRKCVGCRRLGSIDPAAAHSHDELRDDRRHVAHGNRSRRWRRSDGPARPRRDRRSRWRDLRDADHPARNLRHPPGSPETRRYLVAPRRSRRSAARARRRAGAAAATSAHMISGISR